MSDFAKVDLELRQTIMSLMQQRDSYAILHEIRRDGSVNDVVRLILQRAKLRIDDAAENFFRKPKIRLPFAISSFDAARLIKQYEHVQEFVSIRDDYRADLDFQVHKHAMLQSVLPMYCHPQVDEPVENVVQIVIDGFEPADYAMFYKTSPEITLLNLNNLDVETPSFYLVNLFDSQYSVSDLLTALESTKLVGSELIIVVPYDFRMWEVNAANVIDGSYSFEWVPSNILKRTSEVVKTVALPASFFYNDDTEYELRIRPFHSNKIFTMKKDEFLSVHAGGHDVGEFPETRRIMNGFALVSIIYFKRIHTIDLSSPRTIKRRVVAFNKHLLPTLPTIDAISNVGLTLSCALRTEWPILIDDGTYNRTKKAAIQTRITRNLIIPVIYHLYAHSTHIVFNGAILTLQKVMNPEVLCQITEEILKETIPIKIQILKQGNLVKANTNEYDQSFAINTIKVLATHALTRDFDKNKDLVNKIYSWYKDPDSLYKDEEGEDIMPTTAYTSNV